MHLRSRSSRTGLLTALSVCGALAVASVGVLDAPAAQADTTSGATQGLHEGMMPADSPDAAPAPTARVRVPAGATPQASASGQAAGTTLPGVDVASHQHPNGAAIDWTQVRASGQRFAVVKATEYYTDDTTHQPVLYTNPNLTADLNGARAAGLVVGAYVFARPQYSAVTEADQFANAIGTLPTGSLPPVVDLEDAAGLPPAQLVLWTQTFLDRLQRDTGTVPMIYSSPNFWNTAMGGSTAFIDHPLWVANYTTAATPILFGGWRSYALWQYSQSGSVPGITGDVDLDRFGGDSLTSLAEPVQTAGLAAPATLATDRSLFSPSQQYRLDVQADGNLVEYGNGRALWWTGTYGAGTHLDVQTDGNLVLYSASGQALWNTRTYGSGSADRLVVRDDGHVVLTSGTRTVWDNGGAGSDTLSAGAGLASGQTLHSPSSQYRLDVQADGSLVERGNGRTLWSAGAASRSGAHLDVQPDGNLVLYSPSGQALWNAGTYGTGGSNRLVVQDDGNVVLYSGTRAVWNNGGPGSDTVTAGASLTAGQGLHSPSFRYHLDVQADGNLVEYGDGRPVWFTNTYGAGVHLDVQSDGNLVLYSASGQALWNTGTYGSGSSNRLVVQDDGNVVLYSGTRAVWSSLYG